MKWVYLEQCTTCHQPHPLDIFDGTIPRFKVTGVMATGGAEDNQVFISLKKVQSPGCVKSPVSS